MTLEEILTAVAQILTLQKQIADAIATEKDAKRRANLAKACQEGDLNAIRKILFEI